MSERTARRATVSAKLLGVTLGALCVLSGGCFDTSAPPRPAPDSQPTPAPLADKPADRKKPKDVKIAVVYRKEYEISLGGLEKAHPFDVHKYSKIHRQLRKKRLLRRDDTYEPEQISVTDMARIHVPAYIESLKSPRAAAKYLEMPLAAALPAGVLENGIIKPFRYATGGTLLAARLALKCGAAINIGGGYHHAKPTSGEGFCVFADIPIAIRALQEEKLIKRALIIDVDVHQGNGTIVCLGNDETTFTFSMHQRDIYPIPKETGDLDVNLESGTTDETFLKILAENLPGIYAAARPDIVFIVAGCDTLEADPLASIAMTVEGLVKRDAMIMAACVKRGVPAVMTLAGGYSKLAWTAQYQSIANLLKTYGLSRKPADK